jgi:hypothetical protein
MYANGWHHRPEICRRVQYTFIVGESPKGGLIDKNEPQTGGSFCMLTVLRLQSRWKESGRCSRIESFSIAVASEKRLSHHHRQHAGIMPFSFRANNTFLIYAQLSCYE